MARPSACAKCGGRMTRGFVPDNGYGSVTPAAWVEGEPRWSTFFGSKYSLKLGRKVPRLAIESWRCERCGLLENYAVKE